MAIKGKKKSQKKGGQAKRRPAAPRPVAAARRPTPWYRTAAARVSALVALAVIASVIIVIVQNLREDAQALEKRQDQIDAYTDDVRALVQEVRPQVTAMSAIPPGGVPEDQAADLAKDSTDWQAGLAKAQADIQTLPQAAGVEDVTPLYAQAIQLYGSTARTYSLALGLEGDDQAQAITTASELKAQATALWSQATVQLDAVRADAELDPSGLTPPDPAAAGAQQPPAPGGGELPPGISPEDLGGGGQGGSGGKGGGSGGQGSKGAGKETGGGGKS
jgi:uncharacterized membrane protein YgcG